MAPTVVRAPFQKVRIEPQTDRIVTDRKRAEILRQRFLDPIVVDDRPVVIDLNPISVLTLGAADELIVTWLDRVRTPRNPLVVVLASWDNEIRGTLDAALKAGHHAAYLVHSSPEHDEQMEDKPIPIGEVTQVQAQTVAAARIATRHAEGPITPRAVMQILEIEKANTAFMRLDELYKRGLLAKVGANGSTTFYFPLDSEVARKIRGASAS